MVRGGTGGPDAPGSNSKFLTWNDAPTVASKSGDIAFSAFLSGPGVDLSNMTGIWAVAGDSIQLVARDGDQVPGLREGVVFAGLDPWMHLNNNGRIVIGSSLAGPGITEDNNFGYFGGSYAEIHPIIVTGEPIETAPGVSSVVDNFPALRPSWGGNASGHSCLNDAGQFVFRAELVGDEEPLSGVFIAQLGEEKGLAPAVSLTRDDSGIELSWSESGFVLLVSDSIEGPWATATDQSNPQAVSFDSSQRFFRLTDTP
jgi:hypothetical protein